MQKLETHLDPKCIVHKHKKRSELASLVWQHTAHHHRSIRENASPSGLVTHSPAGRAHQPSSQL